MAYELHISRPPFNDEGAPGPIPLEDWKAAVSSTEGVRLYPLGSMMTINFGKSNWWRRKETIVNVPRRDGEAEVYFPDEQTWHAVFRWFEGEIHFRAWCDPGDSSHPVWVAASALASRLGGVISGDDGETYDLQTGEATPP